VAQQYLPDNLQGRVFYEPTGMGREAAVRERVARLREAQLEALREAERLGRTLGELAGGSTGGSPETGAGAAAVPHAEWVVRSEGALTRHVERVREAVLAAARLERQHLVLDANAGGGLLVWEALRRCTQGGVWARVEREDEARALEQQARRLPDLGAPVVVWGAVEDLPRLVSEAWRASERSHPDAAPSAGEVRFDRILARGVLGGTEDRVRRLTGLRELLAPEGWLLLAETIPAESERFFAALGRQAEARGLLPPALARKLSDAEARLYAEAPVAWGAADLDAWIRAAGLATRERHALGNPVEIAVTPELVARWFGAGGVPSAEAPSAGGSRLAALLGEAAVELRTRLGAGMAGQKVQRQTSVTVLRLERAGPASTAEERSHG
jgi:putative ATPase